MYKMNILLLVVCCLCLSEIKGFKWEEFRRQEFQRREFQRRQSQGQELLREKWGLFFSSLDVNDDGSLTGKDVQKTFDNFRKIATLRGEEALTAESKISSFWKKYIFYSGNVITKRQFIDEAKKRYEGNILGFKQIVKEMLQEILDFTDVEHDGKMSKDIFIKICKVFGFYDAENTLKTAFDMYAKKHGGTAYIPFKDVIQDWVIFLTNFDPAISDVVLQMYQIRKLIESFKSIF